MLGVRFWALKMSPASSICHNLNYYQIWPLITIVPNAELDWAGSDPKVRENTRQQLEANPFHPSAKADPAVSWAAASKRHSQAVYMHNAPQHTNPRFSHQKRMGVMNQKRPPFPSILHGTSRFWVQWGLLLAARHGRQPGTVVVAHASHRIATVLVLGQALGLALWFRAVTNSLEKLSRYRHGKKTA